MKASGIVLAGGKSLRFGQNKSFVTIGNKSLLEQVVSCLSPVCRDIIIVTTGEPTIPQFIRNPKIKVLTDFYPGKGPLGGIYTGLKASGTHFNLVVAADMPFLNPELLRYMLSLADSYDLIVPRVGKLVEPLHAVYTKSCLSPIERMITNNELHVSQLFSLVRVRYVETEEIEKFDPRHLSFFNINTEADLAKAREIAEGETNRDKC